MLKRIERIPDEFSRGYALVDLDAVIENMKNMKQVIAPDTQMIGVIKTDAYGHGSAALAETLEPLDFMWGFAVATPEEGFLLRKAGIQKPILILGYCFPYCYEELAKQEIRSAVFREDTLAELDHAARLAGKKIKVHIKVDTGMCRIGITPDAVGLEFVKKVLTYENLELEGMFTHFARADETDKSNAYRQLSAFRDFASECEKVTGYHIPFKHCSNSAGILELPEANMDIVRAGITMYGLYPSDEVSKDKVKLAPALSLYSHIVFIKTIHKGQSVSYGGTYTATEDRRVATIPLGYGDGYPRAMSSKGCVLIHGKRAMILGRVCMDQFMVDVTDIPEAREGDKVVLLGFDGADRLSAEELGEISGRFNYELVCDFGKRIPRLYTRQGEFLME